MPLAQLQMDRLRVEIHPSKAALGEAAAAFAASRLLAALDRRPRARIIVGTGPSQNEVVEWLVQRRDLDWGRIEVFHMDEYVGLPCAHPASFRRWARCARKARRECSRWQPRPAPRP